MWTRISGQNALARAMAFFELIIPAEIQHPLESRRKKAAFVKQIAAGHISPRNIPHPRLRARSTPPPVASKN